MARQYKTPINHTRLYGIAVPNEHFAQADREARAAKAAHQSPHEAIFRLLNKIDTERTNAVFANGACSLAGGAGFPGRSQQPRRTSL